MLADRLHKTPAEIREGFSWDDYLHFMAHVRQTSEAEAQAVDRASQGNKG